MSEEVLNLLAIRGPVTESNPDLPIHWRQFRTADKLKRFANSGGHFMTNFDKSNCTKWKISIILIYIPIFVSLLSHLINFPSYFAFPFYSPFKKTEQGNTLAEWRHHRNYWIEISWISSTAINKPKTWLTKQCAVTHIRIKRKKEKKKEIWPSPMTKQNVIYPVVDQNSYSLHHETCHCTDVKNHKAVGPFDILGGGGGGLGYFGKKFPCSDFD